MKKVVSRLFGIGLALCMVFTLIPINAFAAGADSIVQIARAEVGVSGRPNKYTYFTGRVGGTYSYSWCASFVSWCASQAGESGAIPKTVNVRDMMRGILNAGGSRVSSPQAGDIVVYRRVRDDYYAHVGIMENGSTAIEGNSGNAVRRGIWPGNYSYSGSSVSNGKIEVIYLRPNYKGPINSGGLRIQSYFDCDVRITTTNGQRANLYANPTDASPRTYFSKGQTVYSTRGAKLSDGSTWYEIQALNGNTVATLWINSAGSGVAITNNSSGSSDYNDSDNGGGLRVQSYFDCDVQITTTNGQRANLYANPADASPKTYFSKGQTAYSTRGAKLSDGSTWYEIQALNGNTLATLWINSAGSGVTVTNNSSSTQTPAERKPVNLGSDFYAYIVNTGLGKYVTNDPDGNIASRSQYSTASTNIWRQIWHFTRLSNGAYKIASPYNNYCLDVQEFGKSSGTNARAYLDNGCSAQQWYLYEDNGSYNLRGSCTDCYLDVSDNSDTEGQNIHLWEPNGTGAQRFSIEKVNTDSISAFVPTERKPANLGSNFYAYIVNTGLGKYVTSDTNGNICSRSQYSASSADIQRQIWHFTRLSNGAYKIASPYNNYCLDVQEFGRSSGTNARAYLDNGCSAQQWYLYEENDAYNLRGACTDCYLDVSDNSGAEGQNIHLWEPNGTGAQRFSIKKVEMSRISSHINVGNSVGEQDEQIVSECSPEAPSLTNDIWSMIETGGLSGAENTITTSASDILKRLFES